MKQEKLCGNGKITKSDLESGIFNFSGVYTKNQLIYQIDGNRSWNVPAAVAAEEGKTRIRQTDRFVGRPSWISHGIDNSAGIFR